MNADVGAALEDGAQPAVGGGDPVLRAAVAPAAAVQMGQRRVGVEEFGGALGAVVGDGVAAGGEGCPVAPAAPVVAAGGAGHGRVRDGQGDAGAAGEGVLPLRDVAAESAGGGDVGEHDVGVQPGEGLGQGGGDGGVFGVRADDPHVLGRGRGQRGHLQPRPGPCGRGRRRAQRVGRRRLRRPGSSGWR